MLRKFMPSVGMLILIGLFSFGVLAMQKPNPVSSPPPQSDLGTDGEREDNIDERSDDAEPVACTADAKLCPDGSAVGRVGPNCEFAACPGESDALDEHEAAGVVYCDRDTEEVCQLNDEPVCGVHEDERNETFMNPCFACAEETVVSYVAGACAAQR